MARDTILHRVRTAIGRSVGQPPQAPPELYFSPTTLDSKEDRIAAFTAALEALAGKVRRVGSRAEAREVVAGLVAGKSAVTSNAPYLGECGITQIQGVTVGGADKATLRTLCATVDVGITSADYALAATGSLVMIASPAEQRLVSLLPPSHIAVVPVSRLLSGLDELLQTVARPADVSSSMVLITGPSRTADIEQILVRGVHGPGEILVVLVDE